MSSKENSEQKGSQIGKKSAEEKHNALSMLGSNDSDEFESSEKGIKDIDEVDEFLNMLSDNDDAEENTKSEKKTSDSVP